MEGRRAEVEAGNDGLLRNFFFVSPTLDRRTSRGASSCSCSATQARLLPHGHTPHTHTNAHLLAEESRAIRCGHTRACQIEQIREGSAPHHLAQAARGRPPLGGGELSADAYALVSHARQPPPTTTPRPTTPFSSIQATTPAPSIALHAHPDRAGQGAVHSRTAISAQRNEEHRTPNIEFRNYSFGLLSTTSPLRPEPTGYSEYLINIRVKNRQRLNRPRTASRQKFG